MRKRFRKHCLHHGAHCSAGDLPHGCKARICGLNVDGEQRSRLCAMGITPGTEVEVCKGFPGRCRLRVRGGSFALDRELAEQILCEICRQPSDVDGASDAQSASGAPAGSGALGAADAS